MKGVVTIFAVAITIMLLMALAMNVISAEPPAKMKLNPSEQHKTELNHTGRQEVEQNPSETVTLPFAATRSVWGIEIVDSTGDVGRCTSIALDSDNCPYISYSDWTNYDLKYAKWNGSAWDIETVDSTGAVGEFTST